jgi:hypothetical protein
LVIFVTDKPTVWRALCVELVEKIDYTWGDIPEDVHELLDRARAVLAQPEPEGELLCIDDLRNAWNAQADAANSWDELGIDEIAWFAQQQALTHYARPTIKPVPVAERPWEREGWCDAEGRCWWFNHAGIPEWQLASDGPYGDFSLPHHALPVPHA